MEAYVSYIKRGKNKKETNLKIKSPDTIALEKKLMDKTGLSFEIIEKGDEKGELKIKYSTYDQLDMICKKLL